MNTLAGPDNFGNVKYVVIILGTLILGPILGEILGKGRNKLEYTGSNQLQTASRAHKIAFHVKGAGVRNLLFWVSIITPNADWEVSPFLGTSTLSTSYF